MSEFLWPGGPGLIQHENAFPICTDSVLLASFASAQGAAPYLDLGCGSGIIAILLAWGRDFLSADGIEISEKAAALARENVRINGLEGRVRIIQGDLRAHRELITAGAYGLVVANPPYYPSGSGALPKRAGAAISRACESCTLTDIIDAARFAVRWGGSFCLVHKPERLAEVICLTSARGLEPKLLRFVHYKAGLAPNLFLLCCRRGGRPSLSIEPPLILTDNGGDTDEIRRIYAGGR